MVGEELKILAAVDFHGSPMAENNFSKLLELDFDCIVLMGDLTDYGPASLAEGIIKRARDSRLPTLVVPGNCDPKQILHVLDEYGVNLHGKCRRLDNITFIGLGGSNLTPFNTPFEIPEAEIQEEFAKLAPTLDENWVLVTHAPPYSTKIDLIDDGTHVGSKSIRQFIEQKKPLAALSGHVHEARDIDKLGRTLLINPGPISKGYAAELRIDRGAEIHAKLLEL